MEAETFCVQICQKRRNTVKKLIFSIKIGSKLWIKIKVSWYFASSQMFFSRILEFAGKVFGKVLHQTNFVSFSFLFFKKVSDRSRVWRQQPSSQTFFTIELSPTNWVKSTNAVTFKTCDNEGSMSKQSL